MSNADSTVDHPNPASTPPQPPPPPPLSTTTTPTSRIPPATATLASPASRLAALRNPLEYALAAARESVAAIADEIASNDPVRNAQRVQRAKRLAFMEDLIRSLDIVVYAQLSVMYYLDCSLLRLVMRLVVQWIYFTPKPIIPQLAAPAQPRGAILEALFLLCLFNHIVFPAPSAGEAMRGYLHGGLLIDFVGVKGPVSKWRLASGDIIILLLQWVLVGLVTEVAKVKACPDGRQPVGSADEDGDRVKDVEAEEKRLEKGDEEDENKTDHPLDRFYGGQVVVADIHILDAIKRAWRWQRQETAS